MTFSGLPIPNGECQRAMLYCHDSVGVGHLRRGIAICEHLSGRFPKASFLLLTGTPYVPMFDLPSGVDYVKLPALAKGADGEYHSKSLGLRVKQLLKCRQALLLAAVQSFRPSVFLVDKRPVGVRREMLSTLRWLQRNSPQTRVIFGMRDIEDTPETTMRQWAADDVPQVLDECFDEIWVYGSKSVFDVAREYRLAPRICEKLRYTGYIKRTPCTHPAAERNGEKRVLVTVGGGTDGEDVLRAYIEDAAHRVAASGGHSTIVGGPDLPHSAAHRLEEVVRGMRNTTWIHHTGCMSCLMRDCDLVVCMGGYNTMCETVSFDKPALVIPRVHPRYEQAIRATRWDKLGLVHAIHPETLTPRRLGNEVLALLRDPPSRNGTQLDMGGLERIAERFSSMWDGGGRRETALPL